MQAFQVRNICFVLITTLCLAGFSVEVYAQNGPETAIVHVNIDREWPSNDPEDGESWETAYRFLQDALDRAVVLLNPPFDFENVEIWVAQGTYRPDQDANNPNGTGDREASFNLRNNVRIFGGFDGTEGPLEFDERDWENNVTILDGDIEGDRPISDEPNSHEQRRSINTATLRADRDINETAVIDGFTVTASGRSAFIATDARPWVLGCTLISSTSASAHLRGESIIVFHRCQFQSPMSEPILVDGGARAHCVGE